MERLQSFINLIIFERTERTFYEGCRLVFIFGRDIFILFKICAPVHYLFFSLSTICVC